MTRRAFTVGVATAAQRVMAVPSGFVVSLGLYLFVTSVLSSLWRVATVTNGGAIVGYSAAALTWYVAASEAATISLNSRLIEETGDDIASGAVAVELLRPASVLGVRVASELGRALPRLAACALAGVAYSCLAVGAPPRLSAAVLAAPSLVLAITCNLVAQHAFAAISFWIRDSRSTWFIYQKVVFVVGGMLLPLEVLPDSMASVAKVLPFMAMAYAPARLASGHLEPWLLLVQLWWLAVICVLAVVVFARGERRLQVVGG
jgi:ABC-2 type transport system permease protein